MDVEKLIEELQAALDKALKGGGNEKRIEAVKKQIEGIRTSNKLTTEEIKTRNKALLAARELVKKDITLKTKIDSLIESNDKLIRQNEEYVETIRKIGTSFVGLGKAAFEGEGSISAFTDNIAGLGFLGRRLDVNIETFRQLSQTGANFGKSIVELREAAGSAALPLDDFAKLVANNSSNLAAMFGTTSAGARGIALLGAATREFGKDRLTPLGFTVDEINETLLLNLDSQRRTGILDRLTRDQRIASAVNFAEQLDRLAKLTGQQRDELRRQIESQQSNERFQIALQGVTDTTRQRLQGFAATVGRLAPGLEEGFQDLIANAGRPVTDSAIELIQNIPEAQGVIQDLISGQISSEQALGKIRDASINSMNRFGKATITGQVGFLRLQGDVINLGRRIVDVNGVFTEQRESVSSLVSNLTSFEQATKVLASQFQGIETGMLKAFGPALGNLIGGIQNIFSGSGTIATTLKNSPSITAGLLVAGLTGKFLFNKAVQIGIIAAGTRMGTAHITPGGMGAMAMGGKGLKGATRLTAGLGLTAAGTGLAATAESGAGKAMGVGTAALGGAMTGAQLGLMFGPHGALIGGIAGGIIGGGAALLGMGANKPEKKQFGGPIHAGKSYLTHEKEFISGVTGQVTAKKDIQEILNTEKMEKELKQISTYLRDEAKASAQRLDALNTSNMLQSKIKVATENTARADRNRLVSG